MSERACVPRSPGLAIAGLTALISGVSVFVNSYGVHHFSSPAVYTTAKNLVAAIVLLSGALLVGTRRHGADHNTAALRHAAPGDLLLLIYVGVIGGGVAFVLFFDGLARTAAAPAALLHDTLVIFVAVLAWPVLSERLSLFNVGAIGLLIAGEIAIAGGVGHLTVGTGPVLVLSATVLWAIETVIAKRLLVTFAPGQIALVRMGVGVVVLGGYLVMTGRVSALAALDGVQLGWALLTGALLAAYVATWFAALARARALDVTSVLVASVVVTAVLQSLSGDRLPAPTYLGVAFVALGVAAFGVRQPRRTWT